MDDLFDLKEANAFTLITAIVLLGMTRVLPYRISGQFLDIKKRAEKEFIASNRSKKLVNVTVHFII